MEFFLPSLVLILGAAGLISGASAWYVAAIMIGLAVLGYDSAKKIARGKYSLDYIAILAMVTALATNEFLAGAVISLMILVSEALETYSSREAEAALKKLIGRIPKTCEVKTADGFVTKDIHLVREGEVIFIKAEEIVPLDGHLLSDGALMNEANLTGEIEPQAYRKGQLVKSGLINLGQSVELKVVGDFSRSTYQKIVDLVQEAKRHPAEIVRLAERYNYSFTLVTLLMAAAAYAISLEPSHLLAVLVIATPCPLLIAAPVSFLGGLNKASKRNIIVKKPAALETLSEITTVFFDKTGTLTLGEPRLKKVKVTGKAFSERTLLSYAAAVEAHSLHPLAAAVLRAHAARRLPDYTAEDVHERIGDGIHGIVKKKKIVLKKSKAHSAEGIAIEVLVNGRRAGVLIFEDQIKAGTEKLLRELGERYEVAILTGDSEENARRLFGSMKVTVHARCLPEDKFAIVKAVKARGGRVMMVGDGLNDAPALALADAGVVFSGTENSAAIEAAAVAILNRDVGSVAFILRVAERSTRIARESIRWGIGLSVLGMFFAMFGYVPPVTGAVLQEGIDAAVILNALRAAK